MYRKIDVRYLDRITGKRVLQVIVDPLRIRPIVIYADEFQRKFGNNARIKKYNKDMLD